MNPNDLHDVLRDVAERGEVRGADTVFSAAAEGASDARRLPAHGPRDSNRRILVVAAAVVVAFVVVAVGVARRDGAPMQVQTTPTSTSEPTHEVRVGYRTEEVRPSDATGNPDTAAMTGDLARTVHARLTAYLGRDVDVSADGTGVVASVPTSIAPELVDLLLLPIGRLALDQLGQPLEAATCNQGNRMTSVATRSGTWPSWGPATACWSSTSSVPLSLVWSGRDLITTPAPGAHVEVRPNEATSDVVVDLSTQSNPNGSTACAAGTSCTGEVDARWVVALDDTAAGSPSTSTPHQITFGQLEPEHANVLRAILLAPAYLNPVDVTRLDPDIGTSPHKGTTPWFESFDTHMSTPTATTAPSTSGTPPSGLGEPARLPLDPSDPLVTALAARLPSPLPSKSATRFLTTPPSYTVSFGTDDTYTVSISLSQLTGPTAPALMSAEAFEAAHTQDADGTEIIRDAPPNSGRTTIYLVDADGRFVSVTASNPAPALRTIPVDVVQLEAIARQVVALDLHP